MRIATIHGRVALIDGTGSGAVDVETASSGRFGPEPAGVYERWTEFPAWAGSTPLPPPEALEPESLGSPSPNPRQVFGIGLNYSAHAAESGFARPDTSPPVFTKYPSCITGPFTDIELPPCGHTDWEVELVVVIGPAARHVAAADAWPYVAGLSVGQDVSERRLQMAATPPQFSLGKSYPGSGRWVRGWYARRIRRPGRPRTGLLDQWRASAAGPYRGTDLRRARADRAALPGHAVAARRPHLHRHSTGVGLGRTPPRWLRPGDVLTSFRRRHRRNAPPIRGRPAARPGREH